MPHLSHYLELKAVGGLEHEMIAFRKSASVPRLFGRNVERKFIDMKTPSVLGVVLLDL